MKSNELHRIDAIVKWIGCGAYPGCQVLVLKDGQTVYDKCFGTHSDKDTTAVRPTDMFDLASLTKTTATLLAVMKLYDTGKLKLTDKASQYLPILRNTNKKNITIKDLLLHESGLPPYIRFIWRPLTRIRCMARMLKVGWMSGIARRSVNIAIIAQTSSLRKAWSLKKNHLLTTCM